MINHDKTHDKPNGGCWLNQLKHPISVASNQLFQIRTSVWNKPPLFDHSSNHDPWGRIIPRSYPTNCHVFLIHLYIAIFVGYTYDVFVYGIMWLYPHCISIIAGKTSLWSPGFRFHSWSILIQSVDPSVVFCFALYTIWLLNIAMV